MSPQTKEAYSNAGAMHVLAVSGLHIGILLIIISYIVNRIFGTYQHAIIKVSITILFIWAFAFVTGLSISVLRATIMFSFIAVGNLYKQKISLFNTIALSAFVILLINPLFLFDVGFQLSYIALIGIIAWHPKIYNILFIKNKYIDNLWRITAVSIAAQIATLPISIYYFHQIPTYALLSNLFVIYLATILLVVGIFSILISFISPLLFLVYGLLYPIISVLNFLIDFIAHLPYATLSNFQISLFEVFLMYSIIVSSYLYISSKMTKQLNITLALFIVLLLSDHVENYNLKHLTNVFVYDINNHLALNTITPKKNILIFEDTNEIFIDKTIKNVKNNWSYLDANLPSIATIEKSKNYILKVKNQKIAIINTTVNKTLKPVIVDFVLLNFEASNLAAISLRFPSSQYVMNTNVKKENRTKIRINNHKLHLNMHDIKEDGYFKMELHKH